MGKATAHDGPSDTRRPVRSQRGTRVLAVALHSARAMLPVIFVTVGVSLSAPSSGCLAPDTYRCAGGYQCLELTSDNCDTSVGCSIGRKCLPVNCTARKTAEDCGDARDCLWTGSPAKCEYDGNSCGYHKSEDACTKDQDCRWGEGCIGPAVQCARFATHEECSVHSACFWERAPNLH
jgi:hypothetical protein